MTDILELARRDHRRILNGGVSSTNTTIKFKPEISGVEVEVVGRATKHHKAFDFDTGQPVNSKQSHCTVNEQDLLDLGYVVRNPDNEVGMINHIVTYSDSTGQEATYMINQVFPNETMGNLLFILGDFE